MLSTCLFNNFFKTIFLKQKLNCLFHLLDFEDHSKFGHESRNNLYIDATGQWVLYKIPVDLIHDINNQARP